VCAVTDRSATAKGPRPTTPIPARMARCPTPPQTRVASVAVPSTSVATRMTLHNVTHNSYGMATLLRKETRVQSSEQRDQATLCALIGTCLYLAVPTPTFPVTAAPAAGVMTTKHNPAGLHNSEPKISTPCHPNKWLSLLQRHNLFDKYVHIPSSLQHGFNAGIKYITSTYTLPNDQSITTYHTYHQS